MRADEDGSDNRTLWCGNLSDQVADEILYELFLQAGPLESIRRPRDPNGRPKSFAFVVYKHECSVPYALELLKGEKLFNRALNLSSRSEKHHIPVLDTHLTEFSELSADQPHRRKEARDHRNDKRHSDRKKNEDEPKSWAELNALRGKVSVLNGQSTFKRDHLMGAPLYNKELTAYDNSACLPDFDKLLQMGSQMVIPGMLPFGGLPLATMGAMGPMGLMGPMASSMYPSMQGGGSGGNHYSPEKERRRNSQYDERGSRRDHPYQDRHQENHYDRRHSDNHYDHRRHDRGYSSSRSSHERERRDRRSR